MDNSIMSNDDIQNLLNEIENMEKEPSIIEITPDQIKRIEDENLRSEQLKIFYDVDFAYVKPLEGLLNHIISKHSTTNYSYNLSSLSIVDRIGKVERRLLEYGCSTDDIVKLVPKTTEEVNLLASARRQGFVSDGIVDNNTRVSQAKEWIGRGSSMYQNHEIDRSNLGK